MSRHDLLALVCFVVFAVVTNNNSSPSSKSIELVKIGISIILVLAIVDLVCNTGNADNRQSLWQELTVETRSNLACGIIYFCLLQLLIGQASHCPEWVHRVSAALGPDPFRLLLRRDCGCLGIRACGVRCRLLLHRNLKFWQHLELTLAPHSCFCINCR